MPNLSHIEGFEWGEGNTRKSADKHDVSQQEAEQVFLDPSLIVTADAPHNRQEDRLHALGKTGDGRLLQITFTLRRNATLIRVISARPMHRKERTIYGQET